MPGSAGADEYFAHVSPSSLIFLVVIAVWAVYLTLHVIRRREHLITARNVDRFSVHMRVLQRRAVRNAPRTRLKSSVTLVRAAQQRRLAASAESVTATVAATPAGTPTWATADPPVGPAATGVAGIAADDAPRPREAQAEQDSNAEVSQPTYDQAVPPENSGESSGDELHVAPIQITWPFAVLSTVASLPPRLLRAGALGASFGFAVLAALLAATGAIAPWLVLFGLVPLGVVVGWLPRSAKAERAAKVRQMRARRHARVRAGSTATHAEPTWRELPGRSRTPELPVALEHVDVPPELRISRTARGPAAAASGNGGTVPGRSSSARRSEPFDLLTADPSWSPVPVPPPTYTLKAQARRPMPQPIVGDVPIPIEVDDDFDTWGQARPSRRAVNG